MMNNLSKLKADFIEGFLEKLFAGLNLPKEQISGRVSCKMYPGFKECYYLDDALILEFNLNPTKDKVELIFKVLKL